MNKHKKVRCFRPPSRDKRNVSERSLVCEKPPRRFIFAQMTVGLEECYERIRNKNGNEGIKNETTAQEEFLPVPGSILAGRYKVIGKVGEGQSSLLVKAEDTFHPRKRRVAIKILHASYRNLGPQEASCLLHLKKADVLKVANIAHVLNTFTIGQHFCIVFEFLSSTPLYRYFQMFPFPSKMEKINLIRRIAFQATQCLAVLSSLNIIHTDIKPENIMFTDGYKKDIKIIDFGNAIYWVHDEMSLYFGEFELQTMFYRAPEVWFGLPFGPQIDMWSLGCVLAELYLGEPLFLATSKDEILEKMQAMLGPFPMTPFQSGKYFSTFKKFVCRISPVPGSSKNVVNILKKLGSTDYIFADFLARLLVFDPSLRLSPAEAARHPFLAPECAFGFILPRGSIPQESGYSPIYLTPTTYPHRPKIDEKIKELHYSELDLLRFGTQGNTKGKADNVMKVLPFNYHEESSVGNEEKECAARSEAKIEARESSDAVEKNTVENFSNIETSMEFGVSAGSNVNALCPTVDADRRYNPYNESCSVLLTTKNTTESKKYDASCGVNLVRDIDSPESSANKDYEDEPKQDKKVYPFKESCLLLNAIKDRPSSCTSSAEKVQKGKTFDETCKVLNIIETKQDQSHNAFNKSGSVINTIQNASPITDSVEESETGNDLPEIGRMLLASKDTHSSSLFTKPTQRDSPYREPCNVVNAMDGPRFSQIKSCRGKRKNKKRTRKFVLRKSLKNSRRRDEDAESQSSVSTKEISEDDTEWMGSPAKYSSDSDTHVLKVRFISDDEVKSSLPEISWKKKVADTSIEGSDLADKDTVNFALGRKKEERKEQVQSNELKNFSPTNDPTKQTSKLPEKVNISKANSSQVSFSTSTAGSGQDEDKEEVTVNTHVLRKLSETPLLVQTSNFQVMSSSSKTFEMDGHCRVMKSSSLESFFDALSDDESIAVSSSAKSEGVRTTTEKTWKKYMPVNTSKLSLERKNNCASGKLTPNKSTRSVVTSSKKDEGLSEDSKNNGETINPLITSNSKSLLQNRNSSTSLEMTAVTSSKKEDIMSAKSSKNTKRNTAAISSNSAPSRNNQNRNMTRISLNHEITTHANDSRLVTSSTDQETNNKDSVSSVINKKKPRTPNLRNMKSVFETPSPCGVVTSTRGLLPGGLCDTTRTFSNEKQNTEKIERSQIPSKSPREHGEKISVEKKGRTFKGSETLKIESKDSNIFSTETGERISLKEIGTSHPVDILTQEIAKQPRKRKLEYNNPDSTGETKSWLLDKQAVSSQKTSTFQGNCERKSKSKYCKYSEGERLVNRKENAKKTGKNVKVGINKNSTKSEVKICKEHAKQFQVDKTKQIDRRRLPFDETSLLVRKRKSSTRKKSAAGNGDAKQAIAKTMDSENEMVFDDIFRSKEHATVVDHSQSSDEDYEVLLL